MAKLDKILKSKSFYVVASVLLGIITWLLVLNYTNPKETRTLDIPLTFINQNNPDSLGLSNKSTSVPDSITVKASGRSDIIGNLTASDLYTEVDLSKITQAGTTTLNVSKPECSRLGITISDYYPKTIDFKFDQVKQRYVDVVVEYDNNLLREGFEFVSVTAEPESVPISGFASEIDEIECIKVNLSDSFSVDSIDSNKTASFIGRYILVSGEDVTARYDTEKITVKIEVAKRVPVKYTLTGNPHDDYYVNGTTLSQDTVLLRGPASELRNISSIDIGNIDVTGASENIIKRFNVSEYIPEEVTAYKTASISVTTEILKYEIKSFAVNINSSVSTPGKDLSLFDYVFTPSSYSIRIKGKASDLNTLSVASLGPAIDLTGLGVGEYKIPLEFTSLDTSRFTVIGEYVFTVTITQHSNTSPSPTPSPTPTPTPSPTPSPSPSPSSTPVLPDGTSEP